MKILVTGGAGFIGGNFVHYMVNKYPEDMIVNLDLLTYAGNLETLKPVEDKPNYKFVKGDIADRKFIFDLFEKEKFVAVVQQFFFGFNHLLCPLLYIAGVCPGIPPCLFALTISSLIISAFCFSVSCWICACAAASIFAWMSFCGRTMSCGTRNNSAILFAYTGLFSATAAIEPSGVATLNKSIIVAIAWICSMFLTSVDVSVTCTPFMYDSRSNPSG